MRGPEYLNSELKRSLDLAIAYGSIPSSSPLWLAMYCYNRLRGEALLFRQERVGQGSKPFLMLKFETLHSGAEGSLIHQEKFHWNPQEKEKKDPRVRNRAMAFMRRTGLNELPQMLNVIRGEMSVVGPRPFPPEYLIEAEILFPEIMRIWREKALSIRSGVLGVSPLTTRGLSIVEFDKTAKADIRYYEQATFWKDLSIIAEALVCVFRPTKFDSGAEGGS